MKIDLIYEIEEKALTILARSRAIYNDAINIDQYFREKAIKDSDVIVFNINEILRIVNELKGSVICE